MVDNNQKCCSTGYRFDQTSAPRNSFRIDGQSMSVTKDSLDAAKPLLLSNKDGVWSAVVEWPELRKHPGFCGPIDDAFSIHT